MITSENINESAEEFKMNAYKEIENSIDRLLVEAKALNEQFINYTSFYPDTIVDYVVHKYEENGYYVKRKSILYNWHEYIIYFKKPTNIFDRIISIFKKES